MKPSYPLVAGLLLLLNAIVPVAAFEPVDLLLRSDGSRVVTPAQWPKQREHLLGLAHTYIYGSVPARPERTTVKVLSTRTVMTGRAVETLLVLSVHRDDRIVPVRVGVLRPSSRHVPHDHQKRSMAI